MPVFLILLCCIGAHIYPLFENKSCHRDPLAKLKRELAKAKQEIREVERLRIKVPSKYKCINYFALHIHTNPAFFHFVYNILTTVRSRTVVSIISHLTVIRLESN